MIIWLLAIALTAIACAALYFAAARAPVNASAEAVASEGHFRLALAGIDEDLAAGKIGPAEATAARGELARELLRQQTDKGAAGRTPLGRGAVIAAVLVVAAGSLGLYALTGRPDLPGQPLAERVGGAEGLSLEEAIAMIERRLVAEPGDVQGWTVIAPAYMQLGRYAEAEAAYRQVLALAGPSADAETNLAEVLILQQGGSAEGEAMALLQSAAARDPAHQRSRFYIAGELTRSGDYDAAAAAWRGLIALAEGDEPWLTTARQGLLFAESGGAPEAAANEAIAAMVAGLAARLEAEGGTVAQWTQLVQSHLVLGDTAAAQAAYDAAVAAYPQAVDRGELDTIALGGGLVLNTGRGE